MTQLMCDCPSESGDTDSDILACILEQRKENAKKRPVPRHYCGIGPNPDPTKVEPKPCLPKRKNACARNPFCPQRTTELSVPRLLKIENTLKFYNHVLEPKRIVNLVKLVHEINEPKPKRCALHPKKRRFCRRKGGRKCKRSRAACEKIWLEKQSNESAKLVVNYIKGLTKYTPNYKQLHVAMYMMKMLKLKKRKCIKKYVKTEICKICQQLAVLVDTKWEPYKRTMKIETVKSKSTVASEEKKHCVFNLMDFEYDSEIDSEAESELERGEEGEEGEEAKSRAETTEEEEGFRRERIYGEQEYEGEGEGESIIGLIEAWDADVTPAGVIALIEEDAEITRGAPVVSGVGEAEGGEGAPGEATRVSIEGEQGEAARASGEGEEVGETRVSGVGETGATEDETYGVTRASRGREDDGGARVFGESQEDVDAGALVPLKARSEEVSDTTMTIARTSGRARGASERRAITEGEDEYYEVGDEEWEEEEEGEMASEEEVGLDERAWEIAEAIEALLEEEEEELMGIAGDEMHAPGTSSYVSWCLYVSWLDEFGKNITVYSNCLRKFKACLSSVKAATKNNDLIIGILKNWSRYLSDVTRVDQSMVQYFKDKPITRCIKCRDCNIYDFPNDHEIPEELLMAVDTTIQWKKLLKEAEKHCKDLICGEEAAESVSLAASMESVEILDVTSSASSGFIIEDLNRGGN